MVGSCAAGACFEFGADCDLLRRLNDSDRVNFFLFWPFEVYAFLNIHLSRLKLNVELGCLLVVKLVCVYTRAAAVWKLLKTSF